MIQTYCRKAEKINSTSWMECRFLKETICDFSGSCEDQVDEKQWLWLKNNTLSQTKIEKKDET